MRHLIDPTDLTVAETEQIVALAEDIIANRAKYSEACKGKKLATLFRSELRSGALYPRDGAENGAVVV